ncbi:Uncharacterised protein [Klebsiella pneumoniae]|nr:Uncharacterised protein [Klebsiella pneumoniae]
MADKLIPVNARVSVMASQVACVIAPDYKEYVEVHLLDGRVEISGVRHATRPLER